MASTTDSLYLNQTKEIYLQQYKEGKYLIVSDQLLKLRFILSRKQVQAKHLLRSSWKKVCI